ncbi:MAG: 2,3-diaminopropionate biosynthesis protein SbnA, partial [Patescibacteria group bacterium]
LVKLERIFLNQGINLYAKLEQFNLGGSIKDRPALMMIEEALHEGKIKQGATIIESSSGNMGIALAYVCLRYGLNFIAVVDPRTTETNVKILKALGAKIEIVDWRGKTTGSYLEARFERVQQLLNEIPKSFWPNQHANENNPRAHHRTMEEINETLRGKIDYLFCAASTCGTLHGCFEYIKEKNLNTRIIVVDAEGSVIFGGTSGNRLIPGHGSAIRPAIYREGMADKCVYVNDAECVAGCRLLLKEEAILAGGSSGAIVSGFAKAKTDIPKNSNVVIILPDRGERYLDTIYNPNWVSKNLGEIPSLL